MIMCMMSPIYHHDFLLLDSYCRTHLRLEWKSSAFLRYSLKKPFLKSAAILLLLFQVIQREVRNVTSFKTCPRELHCPGCF